MDRLPALPPLPNSYTFNFPSSVTPPVPTPFPNPAPGHVTNHGSSPSSSLSSSFHPPAATTATSFGAPNSQPYEPEQHAESPLSTPNGRATAGEASTMLISDDSSWSMSPTTMGRSSESTTVSSSVTSNPTVLPAIFIDNLSNDLGLLEDQNVQMHLFVDLGSVRPALTPADLATRLYTLGSILALGAEQKRAAAVAAKSVQDLPALFNDLKIRLENTFVFTSQQRDNIRAIAQDVIYQADRTVFKTMFTDTILEKDREKLRLTNVYGNPWRMKQLSTLIRLTCSSVRNHFRRDICESIDDAGKKKSSLNSFTYKSAMKYKLGGAGAQLDVAYAVHNAILRRFAIDHPLLRGAAEKEEVQEDDELGDDGTVSHTTAEDPEGGPPRKKQKAVRAKRPPKGDDFWSQVDKYFAAKVAALGPRIMAPSWRGFFTGNLSLINDIVRQDERDYPHEGGLFADINMPGHSINHEDNTRSSTPVNAGGPSARSTMPRRAGAHLLNLLN
ncbi:hypothetical protein BN946_scf184978.g22 [Trametes cinnabarina]|uniref:Uncharacterized protein n=1 Tax=Pycnoporus cinnabarinus TaxID=5643 RepID=A0A060SWF4_PYCCI|nr:hypothetical protein BN946_scf184978.g22 [Trametes cinnabarina]